jgi:hypothetical protein
MYLGWNPNLSLRRLRCLLRVALGCCMALASIGVAAARPLVILLHDAEGKPISSASVRVHNPQFQARKPLKKGPGQYVFADLPQEYNALVVEKPGYQTSGFQWFVSQPDTVRLVMQKGPYSTIDEGSDRLRLVFDEKRLCLRLRSSVMDSAILPTLQELGLEMVGNSLWNVRKRNGEAFPLYNCRELEILRRHPLVLEVAMYSAHVKRHRYELTGITITDGSMRIAHLLKGEIRVRFGGDAFYRRDMAEAVQIIEGQMRQFGFRLDTDYYDDPNLTLTDALTYGYSLEGLALKIEAGLSGPILIGQILQFSASKLVMELIVYGPPRLD